VNPIVLRLGRPARRRILRLDRQTRNADLRVRCRIILKVSQGQTRHAAAREVGCAPSTAWVIVDRFRQHGEASLQDGRCDNGLPKVDEDVRAGIGAILEQRPSAFGFSRSTWTVELITRVIAQVLGVILSVGHVWRVLKAMQVRWGRPRPVVACPWPTARRRRRLARLRRLAEDPGRRAVAVYADEVDLHLNPRIGPDWMLPCQQRLVITPGKNVKRYVAGAYDPLRQKLVYVDGVRKTSWLFVALLQSLQRAYRWARTIHVILDNYVIHKSRLVQAVLRTMRRIRLHFLPPYCPNENKIERIWLDLHASVTRNHRCPKIEALMEEVHRYLGCRFHVHRGLSLT
jgi:transposase